MAAVKSKEAEDAAAALVQAADRAVMAANNAALAKRAAEAAVAQAAEAVAREASDAVARNEADAVARDAAVAAAKAEHGALQATLAVDLVRSNGRCAVRGRVHVHRPDLAAVGQGEGGRAGLGLGGCQVHWTLTRHATT